MRSATRTPRPELRRLRRLAGLSVTDLAARLRVTVASVSAWETGARTPSPVMLRPLAAALNVTTERVLEIIDAAEMMA